MWISEAPKQEEWPHYINKRDILYYNLTGDNDKLVQCWNVNTCFDTMELKIVEEVNLGERQKRYELILDKHHHHILCKTCGKIDRIDYCILDKIKDLTNYNILNHSIEFIGICPDCQKN